MKKYLFVVGIYISICVLICGNYYINPKITYNILKTTKIDYYGQIIDSKVILDVEGDKAKFINNDYVKILSENINYKELKYSILFSLVGLILLLSFFQLYSNKFKK
jgi:hypothetical protein